MSLEEKSNRVDPETLERLLLTAPFHRWLGLRLSAMDEQGIEVFLPWREELISNAAIRSTHGGILASLIDLTGLFAVLAKTASAIATADLRVDYHRTAAPGNLLARAEVLKLGSRVSSAQTFVRAEDGTVVASGRGVYLTTD